MAVVSRLRIRQRRLRAARRVKHFSVREWDYLDIGGDGPTRREADRLVEAAAGARIGGDDGARILDNGVRRLRAQQIVGILAADGVTLEILPKIDGLEGQGREGETRRRLVQMLATVLDLDVADGGLTNIDWQRETLLEIFITLFCNRLFEAVRRGLPRRYVPLEEDLPVLRGRLDVARQFTVLAAAPNRLACRFEALNPDIALNRIMKAAVARLLRHARSMRNQRRLRELSFAFTDVAATPAGELPWSAVVIDRTNRMWRQLIDLAKLLLGERFQRTSSGSQRGFSLLFGMNTLFEEYVGRLLQRRLPCDFDVRLQGPRRFALTDVDSERPRFATVPDIVLGRNGETVMVIDTKWKRLSAAIDDPKRGVSQSDIYQMMAYSHVYRCPRTMLLYPHHSGIGATPGRLCEQAITGSDGKRIVIASMELGEPRQTAEALAMLVDRLVGPAGSDARPVAC
jgi:5-methylcytosine-specific restriction enzyme subunit McrC